MLAGQTGLSSRAPGRVLGSRSSLPGLVGAACTPRTGGRERRGDSPPVPLPELTAAPAGKVEEVRSLCYRASLPLLEDTVTK